MSLEHGNVLKLGVSSLVKYNTIIMTMMLIKIDMNLNELALKIHILSLNRTESKNGNNQNPCFIQKRLLTSYLVQLIDFTHLGQETSYIT